MAITFFGASSTPADNGSQVGPGPVSITPPANMLAGDLAVIVAFYRGNASTSPRMFDDTNVSVNQGGQEWNSHYGENSFHPCLYWCRFNGTWTADPEVRVTSSGTSSFTLVMLVFRPTQPGNFWRNDVGPVITGYTTDTITGLTTTKTDTVTIAVWMRGLSTTFSGLTGSGWTQSGLSAQYRNLGGSQDAMAIAYQIKTSAGATNDVSITSAAGSGGTTMIFTLAEVAQIPNGGPVKPLAFVQSAGSANPVSGSSIAATLGAAVTSGNGIIGYCHFELANPAPYLTSVSDDQGNIYDVARIMHYHELSMAGVLFWLPNITNGPTIITASFSGGAIVRGILIEEVAGLAHLGRSAVCDWRPLGNTPENMNTPAITPPSNGEWLFGAVQSVGAPQQDTDFFNPIAPWTERQEVLGVTPAQPPLAIYDYFQDVRASIDFDVQGDTFPEGYNLMMASFAPAGAVRASQSVSHFPRAKLRQAA